MRKWAPIIVISCLLLFFIWWNSEAPVGGGVYPEKQVGVELLVVEEGSLLVPMTLPVRWIKTYPWEQTPVLNEISLFDEEGNIISAIGGEYKLRIPHEYDWYDRNIQGEIELYLNGASFAEEGSISTTTLKDSVNTMYSLNRISLVNNQKRRNFPIDNNYQYHLKPEIGIEKLWEMQGLMYFFLDQNFDTPNGFLITLTGKPGHSLEEIGFWLPGMPPNYFEEHVQYNYTSNTDQYNNSSEDFVGENLFFPETLEERSMVIYFPFTPEMIDAAGDSLLRLMPYFHLRNEVGESYFTGGYGSIGPLDRTISWGEFIYKPDKKH
ncbi:hypothetical protein DS745_13275 [Anaerobacillus alkaliphilus]|uniref:Uncharacterized protein n=1 Tax=Anaerobacillus alkaliphilus TaxID=1548597 RepID=A0A4Q0VU72_9BACI|nr:hypothetical protein [Anaerobacillus alkaliphilus]RXI99847.1 hypothetical protein DS745_13275 [Anaerobacillus alkaliphilus]